ncbi:YlaF family protein [Bacillus sp. ISL-47]|uniref:YlaF family protein n=1 Tax=Bacillus sp. ISL-47 TaxID=2819130 RepID=UPI001BE5F7BF|nr:YlaF family protein [Bacillus sp. ISL-47]MBT2687874.1 YlaF family protein [Bacillus sp. ISL-47]MBT2708049.1 YlaF family protein [Pseudomonas sp. ISL-84]
MKHIKWPLLAFAIGTAVCMMGIGVAVAERSIFGIIFSIVLLVFVMGFGFKTKKKMREDGLL